MGILHSFDRARGVIYTVWDGPVTWLEWRQHASAIILEEDWQRSSRFIVDLRSVTDTSSITVEEVEQASALFTANQDVLSRKRGAVIARDEFRNARRFEDLIASSGLSMVVFNSLDTACLFLGLDVTEASLELDRLRMRLRGV